MRRKSSIIIFYNVDFAYDECSYLTAKDRNHTKTLKFNLEVISVGEQGSIDLKFIQIFL